MPTGPRRTTPGTALEENARPCLCDFPNGEPHLSTDHRPTVNMEEAQATLEWHELPPSPLTVAERRAIEAEHRATVAEALADHLGSALRDVLCADDDNGSHLLPIVWEDRVRPLVWAWERAQSDRPS